MSLPENERLTPPIREWRTAALSSLSLSWDEGCGEVRHHLQHALHPGGRERRFFRSTGRRVGWVVGREKPGRLRNVAGGGEACCR